MYILLATIPAQTLLLSSVEVHGSCSPCKRTGSSDGSGGAGLGWWRHKFRDGFRDRGLPFLTTGKLLESFLEVFDVYGCILSAPEIGRDTIFIEDPSENIVIEASEVHVNECDLVVACQSHMFVEHTIVCMN